jgi:hypothetical protein
MLEWLRRQIHSRASEDDLLSIVFLLRDSVVLTADEAVRMCNAAWGAAAPVKLVAIVSEGHYALEASPLFFAFHSVAQRYQAKPPALSQVQQQCWDQHSAWMSVDMVKSVSELRASGSLAAAYKTLFYFVFKHWSSDTLALYFPCEGVTLPNHGDLIQSIRWCRRNGIDLSFLQP